jgi:hypothetical protein
MIWRMRLYGAIPSGVLLRRDIRSGLLRCESLETLMSQMGQSRRTTMFAMSGLAPIAAVMLQCRVPTADSFTVTKIERYSITSLASAALKT